MSNPLEKARYLGSAHTPAQLPPDGGFEVAFAGRSNAGKSSALNALTRQNALARVSKTPGRTQQLVYFEVAPERYLVDLPGYGYAKVPMEMKAHWERFLDGWFRSRQALRGLVVVMDIRHPLKDSGRGGYSFQVSREDEDRPAAVNGKSGIAWRHVRARPGPRRCAACRRSRGRAPGSGR